MLFVQMPGSTQQEAMRFTCAIHIRPHHVSLGIDAERLRNSGAWEIDGREHAVAEEKTVDLAAGIHVHANHVAGRIHVPGGGQHASWNIERSEVALEEGVST